MAATAPQLQLVGSFRRTPDESREPNLNETYEPEAGTEIEEAEPKAAQRDAVVE